MTGFDSKRKAAQDKLEQWDTPSEAFNAWWNGEYDDSTNPYEKDTFAYWAWAGWQAALAQPAQEPADEDDDTQVYKDHGDALTIAYQSGYYDGKKAALAGREWNFCSRCGKRTADLTVIHTCTPPQDTTNG